MLGYERGSFLGHGLLDEVGVKFVESTPRGVNLHADVDAGGAQSVAMAHLATPFDLHFSRE